MATTNRCSWVFVTDLKTQSDVPKTTLVTVRLVNQCKMLGNWRTVFFLYVLCG